MEHKSEKNKILAIVVTFNRSKLLNECIQRLVDSNYQCDILIVDNASTDNTKMIVDKYLTNYRVKYVNTGANLGGAGGFNFALNYAYRFAYDYFWLMDDDTMVMPESLRKLVDASQKLNGKFGFISSFAKYTDGSACKMNIPTLSKKWYGNHKYIDNSLMVDKATFVGFLISKKNIKEFGLPIKEFFIWADDSEFSSRIARKLPSYLILDSIVIHKMKKNGDANFKVFLNENTDRVERYFYSFRNRFYIAKKTGLYQTVKFIIKLMGMAILTPFLAKNHRIKRESIILKGFCKGLLFNPKVEFVGESYEH